MAQKQSSSRDHLEVSREAGFRRVSLLSVLAGLVTAYGSFAVIAAIVGAILNSLDVKTKFTSNDWTGSGAVASLATALSLLLAYLFGGYVAGRMARRSGLLHGILVFITSLLVGAIVGGVVSALTDNDSVRKNLQGIGVPTNTDQIRGVAIAGVAASLAAILIGSVLGGLLGERWHTKLARRAADPDYGPAAQARAQADREDEARRQRLSRDPLVERDTEAGRRGRHDDDDVPPFRGASANDDDVPEFQGGRAAPDQRSSAQGLNPDEPAHIPAEPRFTAEEWRAREGGPTDRIPNN